VSVPAADGRAAAEVVRDWIERVWNGHDLDALPELHPSRYMNEGVEATPDDAAAWFRDIWATFPDVRYEIDELLVAGDRVVVRWTATGRHEGLLWDSIPATGKRAAWRGIHIVRVVDGYITDVRAVSNMAAIGPQLGLEIRPVGG
jgi:predicted ester cyclase